MGEAGEQQRDLPPLEEVEQAQQHGLDVGPGADGQEGGDRVEDHDLRVEIPDRLVDLHQVSLQPVQRGPGGLEAQQSLPHPGLEVGADRAHVADDLGPRLLEGEVDAALAAPAGRVDETGRESGLAAARATGDQQAAAAVIALAAEHLVEGADPRRDPLGRHLVLQPERGDGQHLEAPLVDDEGILVGAVHAAAVLDDAQTADGELVGHPVVEQDDAVGDVLFEAVAGERALAPLAGDDGGNALVLQPAEQPAQLGAQDALVRQAAEQGLQGVEDDAPGADRVDGVAQADEQPVEVVLAGLLDLAALDLDVVERKQVPGDQVVEVEAQRADVLDELLGPLLEAHEDAGLAVLGRAADEELHGHQRLAAAGAAADQRRPALRQTAPRDLVQSGDARGGLRQTPRGRRSQLRIGRKCGHGRVVQEMHTKKVDSPSLLWT